MSKNAGKIQLLENIRGLAALYVFLGHIAIARLGLKSGAVGFLFRFGQEAVMLFFLLSGFVIYYSFSKSKDRSFAGYFIRRFRRIYPIFILSLAVSYFVACQAAHTWLSLDSRDLLGNLFMLQDFKGGKPGVWFQTYRNDAPLWSLSYEWWFYMMFFPIITRVPVAKQRFLTFGLSLAGFITYWIHPNAPSLFLWYFVIWWSGVEAARVYGAGETPNLRNMRTQLTLLVSMCVPQLLAVLVWKKVLHHPLGFGIHPVLELRHFLFSALVFVLALCSTSMSRERLHKLLQPFAILAPISYGIYVLHYPITIEGRFLNGLHNRWVEAAAYCVVALGVAWFAEIPYQSLMNRWIRVPSPKPALVTLSRGEETRVREREGVNVE